MAVSCWFIDIYDSALEPPSEPPSEPPTEVPAEVPLVLRNTVLFLLLSLSLSLSPPPPLYIKKNLSYPNSIV